MAGGVAAAGLGRRAKGAWLQHPKVAGRGVAPGSLPHWPSRPPKRSAMAMGLRGQSARTRLELSRSRPEFGPTSAAFSTHLVEPSRNLPETPELLGDREARDVLRVTSSPERLSSLVVRASTLSMRRAMCVMRRSTISLKEDGGV